MTSLKYSFAVLAMCLLANAAWAAPRADLWERWTAHDPASEISVDHSPWDAWLKQYVAIDDDGIAKVAYGDVSKQALSALAQYIRDMQSIPVSQLNRDEQSAFWVNLYNASTVLLIIQHMPVSTIRDIDISPGLLSDGPWGRKIVRIEDEELSLDDIEHRVLRPIWQDPRIHYAVNCAALGCPNLWPEAMTPSNAEAYLERGATAFVNHPRGARVEYGRLIVSSIYHWFKEDFGATDAGVIAHLKQYATGDLADKLKRVSRIDDHQYDWTLNGSGDTAATFKPHRRGS